MSYQPREEAQKRKVKVDDYHIIKVLGKGCMGKVLLVRHKKSSNFYALKSISKSSVIVNKELNHTLAERKILSTIAHIQHPFLIQCHHAFTSENELFLVLDFISGGGYCHTTVEIYPIFHFKSSFLCR
jgi:serine/threonine protein kinase